ncbi:DUF3108 domain-containing protein [Roseateles depolymerans]|uniref:Uncharacterized protein n=1 Tax=Roseateles depolymerans TaxID=76731 RepID=A0A0U3LTZ1_9BURK|nr:DUF3108 domain-containing protein [Roseateles depolymerans]ALV08519.1 hypothetical protein RD2015_4070 [Roseateles depolymerans]REG21255.1 uncharacterized protein DUF3108 [Roseateles depolymerans]
MAGGLSQRRTALLAALTLLVVVLHLVLLGGAQQLLGTWAPDTPEPDRIQAVFVRALQPAAPPPPMATRPRGTEGTPGPEAVKVKPGLAATTGAPGTTPSRLSPLETPAPTTQAPPDALQSPGALQLPETPGDYQPGMEWPLSTEMHYQLTGNYRGPVYGQARVQWLREGAHYQVHLEASIGPSFAPLMTRRLSSDGMIGPDGLMPRRFDEVNGGLAGGNRKVSLLFDDGGVVLANGQRSPREDSTQDAASQFVQLTWMFLTGRQTAQPGWLVQLPLALPRRVHLWRYVVRDALETVDTPMGPLQAWHVDSDMTDTWGDMETEMWLAPSLQYLPVRIRIWQNRSKDASSYIDLTLKEAPLQAMPAAAPASSPASGSESASASVAGPSASQVGR